MCVYDIDVDEPTSHQTSLLPYTPNLPASLPSHTNVPQDISSSELRHKGEVRAVTDCRCLEISASQCVSVFQSDKAGNKAAFWYLEVVAPPRCAGSNVYVCSRARMHRCALAR
jgi:hypothetical protein